MEFFYFKKIITLEVDRMYIVGFLVLILGAIVGFFAKQTYSFIMKITPNDMDIIKTKVIGFVTAIIGLILIFIFLR
jgi:uncharacterized membrane protein YeaQ/YmgE (transglycosylase-associated protein family)